MASVEELPESEERPLEEPPEPEEPLLEELSPDPEELENPDELPAPEKLSAPASAAPPEEDEPQAAVPRQVQIKQHHRVYRMFTSRGKLRTCTTPWWDKTRARDDVRRVL